MNTVICKKCRDIFTIPFEIYSFDTHTLNYSCKKCDESTYNRKLTDDEPVFNRTLPQDRTLPQNPILQQYQRIEEKLDLILSFLKNKNR